ncbi:MAG: hypothetical protein ACRDDY_13850 [Clostridium sp.]|uniref:hypothetical protein n=1 Tax=Clostridium sp. TaxID=1506 RepID=UPI003EE76970
MKLNPEDILGIECKHVAYAQSTVNSRDDLLLVKEVIHTKDNRHIPRVRLIENYQYPFYITRKPYRNHKDKKEAEEIDKLQKYMCNRATMHEKIQLALGDRMANPRKRLKDVCSSPYVYGADLLPATHLKSMYRDKWPNLVTRNKVAVLDTERDVVFGTNETIIVTLTMGTEKYIGVVKWWADKITAKYGDIKDTLPAKFKELLSVITVRDDKSKLKPKPQKVYDVPKERGGDITLFLGDTPGHIVLEALRLTHIWRPDFVAIWNMDYDLPHLTSALAKIGIAPEDAFSDPMVPDGYRRFWYKQDKLIKETNSKSISKHPADLWHVVYTTASYYIVDAMCLFKKIRVASGNEPDYTLDGVLSRHMGTRKLRIPEADKYSGLKWHVVMQRDFPLEYCVYALFDCISIEMLDEKTNDIGLTISVLMESSGYDYLPSLPRRVVDVLHNVWPKRGFIPGCVGADITSELDDDVVGISGWICTLNSYCVVNDGLFCISEVPELRTKFRVQTNDADILQAYPTGEVISNGSKKTTIIEVINIDGVDDQTRRQQGINLTGGQMNAVEIAIELAGCASFEDWDEYFSQRFNLDDEDKAA